MQRYFEVQDAAFVHHSDEHVTDTLLLSLTSCACHPTGLSARTCSATLSGRRGCMTRQRTVSRSGACARACRRRCWPLRGHTWCRSRTGRGTATSRSRCEWQTWGLARGGGYTQRCLCDEPQCRARAEWAGGSQLLSKMVKLTHVLPFATCHTVHHQAPVFQSGVLFFHVFPLRSYNRVILE